MSDHNEQLTAFLLDPENFLYSLNVNNRNFEFVRTSRKTLTNFPFLDQRTLGKDPAKDILTAPQVFQLLKLDAFQNNTQAANYLFHTSFCCSTLIARCLDLPGKNLSLKEPLVLLGLALFKRLVPNCTPENPGWITLQGIVFFLLSRRFAKGEKILIKPSNGANNLLPEILGSRNTGKGVFLYSDLVEFLVSVLSGGRERVVYIEGLLNDFKKAFPDVPSSWLEGIDALNLLHKAALVWGLQMHAFQQQAKLKGADKVRTLNAARFLENPEALLDKLNRFYGLDLTEGEQKNILHGPAFTAYSKDVGEGFSVTKREQEKNNIAKIHKNDIRETLDWARALGLAFEEGLPNPL